MTTALPRLQPLAPPRARATVDVLPPTRVALVEPRERVPDRAGLGAALDEESFVVRRDLPHTWAWALAGLPVGGAVAVVAALSAHRPVPGGAVLAGLALLSVLAAHRDARSLAARGVSAPRSVTALLPPVYLALRARTTRDPRAVLAWFPVVALAAGVASLAMSHLSPVGITSEHVQRVLTQEVLAGSYGLDVARAQVGCPAFEHLWRGDVVRCTAWDTSKRVTVEVSLPEDGGPLSWQPLTP